MSVKAILVKLLYARKRSATVSLHKFQAQKNVKNENGPIIVSGFMKFVQSFEEIVMLKDRERFGRPSLRKKCLSRVSAKIEMLASKLATASSNNREAERNSSLPAFSVRNTFYGIFDLYA